jgi:hypothetical protein
MKLSVFWLLFHAKVMIVNNDFCWLKSSNVDWLYDWYDTQRAAD